MVSTVGSTEAKELALLTLITPPPPPLAEAEMIPSPAVAAKDGPPMPTSCCVPENEVIGSTSSCAPLPWVDRSMLVVENECVPPLPWLKIAIGAPPDVAESWKLEPVSLTT